MQIGPLADANIVSYAAHPFNNITLADRLNNNGADRKPFSAACLVDWPNPI